MKTEFDKFFEKFHKELDSFKGTKDCPKSASWDRKAAYLLWVERRKK